MAYLTTVTVYQRKNIWPWSQCFARCNVKPQGNWKRFRSMDPHQRRPRIGRWEFQQKPALWSAINTMGSSELDLPYDHWMNPLETAKRFSLGSFTCSPAHLFHHPSIHSVAFARYCYIVCSCKPATVQSRVWLINFPNASDKLACTLKGSFLENCLQRIRFAAESGLFLPSYMVG